MADGPITLARRSVDALRALQGINGAPATGEQRAALAGWAGWGPLAPVFEWRRPGEAEAWTEIRSAVQEYTDAAEYKKGHEATPNAFYTPPRIAAAIWQIVTGLGFTGGRVLEPGCGNGVFITTAPPGLPVEWTGVEADPVTARIAAALHPQARIIGERLERTPLRKGGYDLTVGNVPFGDIKPYDPGAPDGLSIHDYFIWRALYATRPGGLVAVLTSRWTSDSKNAGARRELARLGEFLSLIRLPSGAFRSAGTGAIQDIIVFRRRPPGGDRAGAAEWMSPAEPYADTTVSPWLLAHPGMALGRMEARGGKEFGHTLDVTPPPGADPAELLGDACGLLVKRALDGGMGWLPPEPGPSPDDVDPAAADGKDRAFILHDGGRVTQRRDGAVYPVKATPELVALIGLRDAALALIEAETTEGAPKLELAMRRGHAHGLYQEYVTGFGPLNRCTLSETTDPETGETVIRRTRPQMGGFRQDPDYPLVLALEKWDDDTQTAEPAPILLRRVNQPPARKTRTDDPTEALALCLDAVAAVDLDVLAGLLTITPEDVPARLGGQIWQDPATRRWVTRDEYLSGNVREKLAHATTADEAEPGKWAAHVTALRAAQPEDLRPEQIRAQLGAPWVPATDVQEFIYDILDAGRYGSTYQATVKHEPLTAAWEVKGNTALRQQALATTVYGTERVNALDLIQHGLNGTAPTVYDTRRTSTGSEERVRNEEQTQLAAEKLRSLQERFGAWIWEHPKRADRLLRVYNDTHNAVRLRNYDGSILTFPGLDVGFTPYQSQRDMVMRLVHTPAALCGFAVGAGKAQPMDALVLTPSGFRRMGDLMVGDHVISVDGTPTEIVGVFPQGPRDNYRVTFSDDATVECDGEHLWEVTTPDRKVQGRPPAVLPIRDIAISLYGPHGHPQWEVPIAQPADFDCGLPRPLDPYLLGLLLGDGSMAGYQVRFTSADQELVDAINQILPEGYKCIWEGTDKRPYAYRIVHVDGPQPRGGSALNRWLCELGVQGLTARYKHVPRAYLEAPAADRLAMLQGLLDTDGTVDGRTARASTTVTSMSASKQMAEDIVWLARSLGGTGRLKARFIRDLPQPYYYVWVTLPAGLNPFRLRRKAVLYRPHTKYPARRAIVSVEHVGRKPMQCIAVAHLRQLYVTNDFIVTHNTAVMIMAALTLRRFGLVNKPVMVVPNHLLEQAAAEARRLYPAARVLMVTKEDLTKERRKGFLAKVACNPWDLIVMTVQQFAAIPVSPQTQAAYIAGLIDQFDAACKTGDLEETRTVKRLAAQKKKLEARHEELLDSRRDDGLLFERTGIDYLVIDEFHNFKNLQTPARAEGFSTAGSKRADDLLMKICCLRDRNPGGRWGAGFTGTPISNSLAEAYVLLRYLCPGELIRRGLASFDAWAAMHIVYATRTEVAPDGSGFRQYRRPYLFCNLPELRTMLGQWADIRTRNDLALDGPEVREDVIQVEPTPALREYTATLVERADKIRNGGVQPDEDNMLSVCGDGRSAALDLRLVGRPAQTPSKVEAAAERIAAAYHQAKHAMYPDESGEMLFHPRAGGMQLVFCDRGTPSKEHGEQVYGWLRDQLTALGVPREQVAFIHDAKTDADKKHLFTRCRDGRVAVLIGSTEKCGTGVNVQHRMTAVHHLDAPWRPADVEQRDGRGDRPGNMNPTLHITRYITTGSFDAYMWQALERKLRFINQVLTGDLTAREIEDIGDGQVLNYAQIKAMATGQPLLLELSEVNAQISRLWTLRSAHNREQVRLDEQYAAALTAARHANDRAAALRRVAEAATGQPHELVKQRYTAGGALTDRKEIAAHLASVAGQCRGSRHQRYDRERYAGTWRGADIHLRAAWALGATDPDLYVTLEPPRWSGGYTFRAPSPWKQGGPARVLNEIDSVIDTAGNLTGVLTGEAQRHAAQASDLRPLMGRSFPQSEELQAALQRRTGIEREIDAAAKPAKDEPSGQAAA